jgi:hypothetical protein
MADASEKRNTISSRFFRELVIGSGELVVGKIADYQLPTPHYHPRKLGWWGIGELGKFWIVLQRKYSLRGHG